MPLETIRDAVAAIREGRATATEVLEGCLARIDEREGDIRAWVIVDREGARERARRLDDDAAAGRWRGPLHGVPLGIKDIIDVEGLPTACGVGGRCEPAGEDARVVARLRGAGAIVLGKTVTTPYAWIDPPVTANPHGSDRTPGGSSSGSAAAVAAGMCLGALGSQTGGSITRPAAFCGVAGLKPTFGALPASGILPLAPSLDHPGAIAPTAGDLALLWEALADVGPAWPRAGSDSLPRIGRLRGPFDDRAEPVMREALGEALGRLADAGASVVDVPLPAGFDAVFAEHRRIMAAEAAAFHADRLARDPGAYPPRIRELIEEGLTVSAVDYLRARRRQGELREAFAPLFRGVDVLATPAAPGPAPDRSTTGDPVMNSPWSFLGLPTVGIPIRPTPDGLPMGLQLAGPPGSEPALIAAAARCEATLGAIPPSAPPRPPASL